MLVSIKYNDTFLLLLYIIIHVVARINIQTLHIQNVVNKNRTMISFGLF